MALGITVWPGITRVTPSFVSHSALIRGGMGFNLAGNTGLNGLGDYATDANGNTIYDAAGNPIASNDYAAIGQAIMAGIAALNSQQVFQLNLQRAQAGLAPISLPGTTSLLNTSSNSLLMMGAGLVALLYFMKRR